MFDIVINPAGASGKTNKLWKNKIQKIFDEANVEYKVYYSTLDHDIHEILHELTSTNTERSIVIIGGDGTMNLAVNGIENFEKTKIGLIPCGSGNDLAKGLNISKDVEQVTKQILKNEVFRKIDVGEVVYFDRSEEHRKETPTSDGYVHHRFNISSGIGFDAAICEQAQVSKTKDFLNKLHLGKLIYIVVAIKIIATTKRVPSFISVDGSKEEYSDLLFTVGMNTAYEGGGFKFCPHCKSDDHLLDLCIGNNLSQWDFFRIFPYAYSGSHLKFKGVTETRGKEIEIQCEKPMWVHTDGEVACKSKHIKLQLLNEQLQMLD